MQAVLVVLGLAIGAFITWLVMRARAAGMSEKVSMLELNLTGATTDANRLRDAKLELEKELARSTALLEMERAQSTDKLRLLEDAQKKLEITFQALSGEALKSNNQAFLELAKAELGSFQKGAEGELEKKRLAVEQLVTPIEEHLQELHKTTAAVGDLVGPLQEHLGRLEKETNNLVRVLRTPGGTWGEEQLRRIVELADMLPYCDFVEQHSLTTSEGKLRPDLIVRLPGTKQLVVDAKAPKNEYLAAMECQDEEGRRRHLAKHAENVRSHMSALASKAYSAHFQPSPEFVVMFLPSEAFFIAALQQDPTLFELGAQERVLVASPMTLLALLRTVARVWQQEQISRSAEQIAFLGKELYDRLRTMADYFEDLRKGLDKAVESYNKAIGSLENRVFVTARKFSELGTSVSEPIPEVSQIDRVTRGLGATDWKEQQLTLEPEHKETAAGE